MFVCRLWCALNYDSWVSPQKGPENGSSCIPDSWVLKGCNVHRRGPESLGAETHRRAVRWPGHPREASQGSRWPEGSSLEVKSLTCTAPQ